jgi:hypothetical protein
MSNTAERQTLKVDMETLQLLKAQKVRHLKEVGGKISLSKYLKSILMENEQVTMAQSVAVVEKPVEVKPPEVPAENKECEIMAGESTCVNCQFKDRDISDLKKESERIKAESERQVKEMAAEVATLKVQLSEKPEPAAADAIPENLEEVIAHCESGQCAAHAKQWAEIQRRVIDANSPAIVQHTLENLPDAVVESEGLKRGLIPQRITIPIRARR